MKTFFETVLFGSLMIVCVNSYASSESEAEDMVDLTAVLIFLKDGCGYQDSPNGQIRHALAFFAQQNQWNPSNYNTFDMKALGEDSCRDPSGIGISVAKECRALTRGSLGLFAYVEQSLIPFCRDTDCASTISVNYCAAPSLYGC